MTILRGRKECAHPELIKYVLQNIFIRIVPQITRSSTSSCSTRPKMGAKELKMLIHRWFKLNKPRLERHQEQLIVLINLSTKSSLRIEIRNSLGEVDSLAHYTIRTYILCTTSRIAFWTATVDWAKPCIATSIWENIWLLVSPGFALCSRLTIFYWFAPSLEFNLYPWFLICWLSWDLVLSTI